MEAEKREGFHKVGQAFVEYYQQLLSTISPTFREVVDYILGLGLVLLAA